jgi:peptidyl-dipeptidase Dcp
MCAMRLFFRPPPVVRPLALLAAITLLSSLAAQPASTSMRDNPLLVPSPLPYQMPPFDRLADEHFAPAFAAAMEEELREVDQIARQSAPPTFDNTIIALERSGQNLARINRLFSNLNGADTNPARQQLDRELAPRLAAHRDAILLNSALFARLEAIHGQRDRLDLDPESKRLVERIHESFVRAGAKLPPAGQARLRALNSEIATLQTTFSQNVLAEVNDSAVLVTKRDELAGLPAASITAAARAAEAAGHPGAYLLRLQNTTGQPMLAQLENRALRQRIHEASINRGIRGNNWDNREVISRLVRLRAERAQLLGFDNHAAFVLADETAGTIESVETLLDQLTKPAVANARQEAADLQAMIDREGGGFQLAPWDWSFYAEKVRRERYAFDEEQVRPYFELDRVLRDGVFHTATQLFGLKFVERHDLPAYHPDVRVWEVLEENGQPLGLFLGDFYARPSKRGGAWMNAYVTQSILLGTQPVVGNHLNVPKPPDGEPTLLTFSEAVTLFHEFGHALHGMLSNVTYPRFSGTNVPRDFVEYPSKGFEMWVTWLPVLKNYARHHQTGEPMPVELLEKVLAAEKFNQGFATTEYLASSWLDQAWHQATPAEVPAADAVERFEEQALRRAGVLLEALPPRYRSGYFSHVFSGGYSAGYYAYIWAEVLDADTANWFVENGGLTRENGERYRRYILSRGGSVDAMELYRAFRGRDPEVAPLLERRGLIPDSGKK